MTSTQGRPILTSGEVTRPLLSEAEARAKRAACPWKKEIADKRAALLDLTDKSVYAFLCDHGGFGKAISEIDMDREQTFAEALDDLGSGQYGENVLAVYEVNFASGGLCDVSEKFAEGCYERLRARNNHDAEHLTDFILMHHPLRHRLIQQVKEADLRAGAEAHALDEAIQRKRGKA
jgi:hypothetical protein